MECLYQKQIGNDCDDVVESIAEHINGSIKLVEENNWSVGDGHVTDKGIIKTKNIQNCVLEADDTVSLRKQMHESQNPTINAKT
jgi:hypothetical protein